MSQKTKLIQKQRNSQPIKQIKSEKKSLNVPRKVAGKNGTYTVQNVIYRKNNELGLVAVLELKGTQYIGKLISLSKQNTAISEIYFLNRLKGESICNLIDVVKTPSGIWIIMEKGWKSLLEYNVKSQEVETVLKNIASAYVHFYKDNIAHRDIKLNNIVIEADLRVRFIDLELCQRNDQVYGTLDYIPPELKAIRWNTSDVFAYGIVAKKLNENAYFYSQKIVSLINGCTNPNPAQRWNWEDIFNFWGINILGTQNNQLNEEKEHYSSSTQNQRQAN